MVLACARPDRSVRQREASTAALNGPVDWSLVARLGLRHRIIPLLHRHLAGDPRVPPNVREGLRTFAESNRRRSLIMAGELALLNRQFAVAGVAMIALKGPALAQVADGEQGLRTMADLDLLVRPADFEPARAILGRRGFRLILETDQDDTLVRQADGLVVEMHRRLYREPGFHFRLPDAASKPTYVNLGGQMIESLPLLDNLLYLAHHGMKHWWSRLAWLTAFAGLLEAEQERIDIDALRVRARALRIGRSFDLALHLARDALQITMPAGWLDAENQDLGRLSRDLLTAALTEPGSGLPKGDEEAARLLLFAAGALPGYVVEGGGPVHGLVAIESRLPQARVPTGLGRLRYIFRLRRSVVRHLVYVLFLASGPRRQSGFKAWSRLAVHTVIRPVQLSLRLLSLVLPWKRD